MCGKRDEVLFGVFCGGCNKPYIKHKATLHAHARRHHPPARLFSSLETLFEMMTLVIITYTCSKVRGVAFHACTALSCKVYDLQRLAASDC